MKKYIKPRAETVAAAFTCIMAVDSMNYSGDYRDPGTSVSKRNGDWEFEDDWEFADDWSDW